MKKIISVLTVISIILSLFSFGIISSAASTRTGFEIKYGFYLTIYNDVNSENLSTLLADFTEEELNSITHVVLGDNNETVEINLTSEDFLYIFSVIPNVTAIIFRNISNLFDISFIEGKTNLNMVAIYGCSISDISPITTCPNLTTIDFGGNNITDISPITSCSNLVDIDFSHNNITDISPITACPSLADIDFSHNNISDISPITACPSLADINFSYNNISDISPMYSLNSIKYADFSYNQIRDVNGLEDYYEWRFSKIEEINLSYNPLGGQLSYIESIENYSSKIKLEGLYSDEPLGEALVTPEDFRACVFDYVTVDNENKVITINSKPGAKSYVAIYPRSYLKPQTGGTIKFSVPLVAGEVETYAASNRYKFYKPADSNTYTTTLTTKNELLTSVTYTLVVNFVKAPFDVAKLTTRYAENVAYDAETKALTMDSTSTNITRIYKSIGNGEKLSIDLEKYDFITEYPNFYQINRAKLKATDLNIASFDITTTTDETIKATVNFPGAGKLPMNMFKITRYSELTQDGTTITLDIVDGYTYSCIYKDVKDGSTLTITSDSKYVEERDNCYVLRAKAAGEQITLTYGGVDYTVNLVK